MRKEKPDLLAIENGLHAEGFALICGVDEAGRGPLAGPVCAGAVILPQGLVIEGLDDSKKLSEKKREALFPLICEKALSFSIAFSTVEEPELALIDGNRCPETDVACRALVGGDGKCASVAAASVLAKVSRDRLMRELAQQYPQYGFEKHKGYGTKAHMDALRQYGPCAIHRMSFLKNVLP